MTWNVVFRSLATFVALISTGLPSLAQYPDRPLKIIVAWPPGGVVDTTARLVGEQLAMKFGQPVVVRIVSGQWKHRHDIGGARAPADGYTLQAVTAETHAINPNLYKTITYDVFRDFDPVSAARPVKLRARHKGGSSTQKRCRT